MCGVAALRPSRRSSPPVADVDQLGAHTVEYGDHSLEMAKRDWWRHASRGRLPAGCRVCC
ncbi:hypothetical protein [Nonomuraea sp. NPDC049709]|uniref:hypothetical protein n=1 Tax=Nonomuraea sp. NPDC049709 TaxID=3154736 RepID=UPI00343D03CD